MVNQDERGLVIKAANDSYRLMTTVSATGGIGGGDEEGFIKGIERLMPTVDFSYKGNDFKIEVADKFKKLPQRNSKPIN